VKRLPVRLDGKRGPNDYLAPTVATSSISDRQTGETVGKVDQRFQELSAVAPEILRIVRPFISADALKSRLSPTEVNVNLNIDEHGAVTKAELDPGSKAVSAAVKEAALAAAKRWQFRPAQRDGENISSQFAIRFRFQPVNQ
jgi:TonB family protein